MSSGRRWACACGCLQDVLVVFELKVRLGAGRGRGGFLRFLALEELDFALLESDEFVQCGLEFCIVVGYLFQVDGAVNVNVLDVVFSRGKCGQRKQREQDSLNAHLLVSVPFYGEK